MQHRAMMEKYEDFLILFRPMILLQIFVSSLSVILLLFTFMMGFSNVEIFEASTVVLTRLFCTTPPILIQLFTICYLYGNIHNQKDSIVFALYSSNWTEMDMKCKKLILLTMQLNNANHKKLKFTGTKIVNLEMFFKTMGDCYTVISVLVNYIQQNVDRI
ncbi:odorant receptor 46a-like [Myzus persicae]|uniref:odorant receptor 46a-like n=1 Tax=Myzus persicae TaxID=13164 RepID=UPI000B9331EF|nr:odorant receptor 46a-like [Myzus persicae]